MPFPDTSNVFYYSLAASAWEANSYREQYVRITTLEQRAMCTTPETECTWSPLKLEDVFTIFLSSKLHFIERICCYTLGFRKVRYNVNFKIAAQKNKDENLNEFLYAMIVCECINGVAYSMILNPTSYAFLLAIYGVIRVTCNMQHPCRARAMVI